VSRSEFDHVITKDELGHDFGTVRSRADLGLILPTKVRAALSTLPSDFTGKIEINCFKGGVSNINIAWSVKTD
jgi:hypothetical protein